MTYSQAIQFLYSLRWFGTKLGLTNTLKLAELAGNPHHQLRFIHVAGTNGKGSTCAMLESIYRAAGLRVGLFTSPHLVAFGERIQVDRQLISESDIIRLVEQTLPLLEQGWGPIQSNIPTSQSSTIPVFHHSNFPTFFEVVTVMALRFFAEQKCDLVVWETGLGGRLDATNIVTPLASVITNIQYDHQKWLGETLVSIAAEKAGIIKSGVPVITATDEPDALTVIQDTARLHNSPLTILRSSENARAHPLNPITAQTDNPKGIPPQSPALPSNNPKGIAPSSPGLPSLRGYPGFETDVVTNPERVAPVAHSLHIPGSIDLPLLGAHQSLNAALAIATARVLAPQIPVNDEAIRTGLSRVNWPGRLQLITRPSGQKILLDGAHNIAGAKTLATALAQYFSGVKPTLILGILQDKDWEAICNILAPLASRILLVPVPSDRTANPAELSAACQRANPKISIDLCASLSVALSKTISDPFVLITGSLYLVGEALDLLGLSISKAHNERALNEWDGNPKCAAVSASKH